jgi:predicted metal-dependent peptidase
MNCIDKIEIAKKLQNHHYFFRAFWDIGEIDVTDSSELPTAAIYFDEKGNSIKLSINSNYWESLNEHSRLFLICHEMLHVLLHHGKRFIEYYGTKDIQTMNYAADVVINEMLCDGFGFIRNDLVDSLKDKGCWFDTVFKNQTVNHDDSTEYYFNLLKKDEKNKNVQHLLVDEHKVLSEKQLEKIQDELKNSSVLDSIDDQFIDKLPEKLQEFARSANGFGCWHSVNVKATKKKKWENVIKKWENLHKKETIETTERWERINPLYSQIITKDVYLPANCKVLDEYKEKNKIDVFFFLDTSGSCINLKDRFFKAAKSLDKNKFNIRLFCFDTRVVETTLESGKVYGGGGTLFDIIEQKIQNIKKTEKKQYPKAVFIITDGFGNSVVPEKPEKWYWFLTNNYRSFIPSKSKVYKLSDYE